MTPSRALGTPSYDQTKPAPELGSVLGTDYLMGLGTLDERMLMLVDLEKLMSSDEMGLIGKIAAQVTRPYVLITGISK